ncbi:MAG: GntR family transcriptional regulator [Chloroflexota bacterium]
MTDDIVLNPASGTPLAQQIRQQFARFITSGQLHAGELLPSVRQLAGQAKINVNTVRMAYQRLERDGLVRTSQ